MSYSISLWEQESFFAPQDFVIVGGGLTGLWVALELKKKFNSAKITILERGVIPVGASTRNAGFACFGSPTEMLSDIKKMGEDEMWKLVEMRYKGIEKIRKTFGDEKIDFDGSGGYECFIKNKHNVSELQDEVIFLNQGMKSITGLKNTFTWCNEKLFSNGLSGFDTLLENTLEGGLHSGKLINSLINKARQQGIQILNGIEVSGWKNNTNHIQVSTSLFNIKTLKLIITTNAFNKFKVSDLNEKFQRGQILVTEPINDLQLKGTYHFDEGFYYFRNIGNRILIGGARNADFDNEITKELDITNTIQKKLEYFLNQHIMSGCEYKISYRWSGIMGFTTDKKPMIKEVEPGIFKIIGCNGMGVALSPMIAEQVAGII